MNFVDMDIVRFDGHALSHLFVFNKSEFGTAEAFEKSPFIPSRCSVAGSIGNDDREKAGGAEAEMVIRIGMESFFKVRVHLGEEHEARWVQHVAERSDDSFIHSDVQGTLKHARSFRDQ